MVKARMVEVVCLVKMGFWDNHRKYEGDTFFVPEAEANNAFWWKPVNPKDGEGKKLPLAAQPRTSHVGNANAVHVPGSPADKAAKRARVTGINAEPEAEGEEPEVLQAIDVDEAQPSKSKPRGGKKEPQSVI